MNAQTEAVITAVCAADTTIDKAAFVAALAVLRGERVVGASDEDKADEVMTREEVARLFRVSRVTVSNWAKEGVIRRIAVNGRRKAVGYSRRSVLDLLNGKSRVAAGGVA